MTTRTSKRTVRKQRRTVSLGLERLEERSLLASLWQNPFGSLDVDDSGDVAPRDALLVINDLDRLGSRLLGAPPASLPLAYVDVNGSGSVEPLDALLVINTLNDPLALPAPVERVSTQRFHVNVATGSVNVIVPRPDDGSEGEFFTGSTLLLNSSQLLDQPGDVGRKVLQVSLTNRSGETIGQLPSGAVTGLRVLFSPFTNVGEFSDLRPTTTVATLAGTGVASSVDGPLDSATFDHPNGAVADGDGALYVVDFYGQKVRKISGGFVSTLAGSTAKPPVSGSTDGIGAAASFSNPCGIARNPIDGALFVSDYTGQRIRRVTADGVVTTVAGTGVAGDRDGVGTVATFRSPAGLAIADDGTIYVVEVAGNRVRKLVLTPGGDPALASSYRVSVLAGSTARPPVSGSTDGIGAAACFNGPFGVAVDDGGTLYVADSSNHKVRRVTAAGQVTTIAGTGVAGSANGAGNVATFTNPQGIAVIDDGSTTTLLVGDTGSQKVRQMTWQTGGSPASATSWQVRTLAGPAPGVNTTGTMDGAGDAARFSSPNGIAVDGSRNAYVMDYNNNKIRRLTPTNGFFPVGLATGSAPSEPVQLADADGVIPNQGAGANLPYVSYPGSLAHAATTAAKDWTFAIPSGVTAFEFTVAVEANTSHWAPPFARSNRYGTGGGSQNNQVRTLAGSSTGQSGFADGIATEARFSQPSGVAVDDAGNTYVADFSNSAISRISASGQVSTVAGSVGAAASGTADGIGTVARFIFPVGVAVSPDGTTLFVTDAAANKVRRITLRPGSDPTDPANWTVSTIVGTGGGVPGGGGYANGTGDVARMAAPLGITIGPGGNVYVTELGGNRVRRLQFKGGDPSLATSWEVSLVAGDSSGTEGDTDGIGSAARFDFPRYIAADRAGNLYVTEEFNDRIRKITSPNSAAGGTVSTLAGSTRGYVDATGAQAKFNNPTGIAVDSAGFVYVSDYGNRRIRRISPGGVVETVAGTGSTGSADGPGDVATFSDSTGDVEVDAAGNLYVADCGNHSIRLIQRALSVGSP